MLSVFIPCLRCNRNKLQIYKIPEFKEVASYQMDVNVIKPQKDGWVEQNPLEILETVRHCAKEACYQLSASGTNSIDCIEDDCMHLQEFSFLFRL